MIETKHYVGYIEDGKKYVARKRDVERKPDDVDQFLDDLAELFELRRKLGEAENDQGKGQR